MESYRLLPLQDRQTTIPSSLEDVAPPARETDSVRRRCGTHRRRFHKETRFLCFARRGALLPIAVVRLDGDFSFQAVQTYYNPVFIIYGLLFSLFGLDFGRHKYTSARKRNAT